MSDLQCGSRVVPGRPTVKLLGACFSTLSTKAPAKAPLGLCLCVFFLTRALLAIGPIVGLLELGTKVPSLLLCA